LSIDVLFAGPMKVDNQAILSLIRKPREVNYLQYYCIIKLPD